jgi:hypothetical protein
MNPNLMGPGKLPTDFTNINIPSVFTEGITVAKKIIKTTQKKKIYSVGNSVSKIVGKLSTLFIMSITKGIIDGTFRQYFTESYRTIHFTIALLITVLYRQNH